MRYLSFCLLLATATGVSAQSPTDKPGDKITPQPITLTACVAAGIEPDTYMLSNVLRPDTPVGTTGSTAPDVVYWLNSPGKLKSHVGHQVRVTGLLEDDVSSTTVKEKNGKVEMKKGTKTVEVLEGTTVGEAVMPGRMKRVSYKVRVQSVKTLSGSCSR
jgi:hypothetical protein